MPASANPGPAPGASWRARLARSRFFIYWVLAGTLLLWGSAFVAIPIALRTIAPTDVVGLRLMLSAALFLPVLAHGWKRAIVPALAGDWKLVVPMAFFGVTVYVLALTYGQRTVGAGETSLLINLTPLATGAFAALLLKERFHPRLVAGGAVAFSGVALLVTGRSGGLAFDPNALFILLAMASASLFYVIQRRLTERHSPLTLSALAVVIGAALALPFTPGALGGLAAASTESLLALGFIGAFSGVLPYVGWAYVLSRLPAAKATLFLYFIPVIATGLGWAVLGEAVTLGFLVSGAIIILGVMIGNGLISANPFPRVRAPLDTKACRDCG